MAKVPSFVCFVIVLLCAPSLSLYLGQIVPQYYLPYVLRSTIPKPVPRTMTADPQLSRLLMARRQAIKIATDIEREIKTLLQNKVYRRTFNSQDLDLDSNGFPFFNPKPANTLSAVIGVQGGAWYPGPSGAGIEGSRMLEGRASQFSVRRNQDARMPLQRGPGPARSMLFPNPLQRGPGPAPTMLQRAMAIKGRYAQMVQQGQAKEISTRTFTPTTPQTTPDPSDEVDNLGNPEEFDKKCAVLKLTFENSDGDVVFDDSPQMNNGLLEGEASVLKEEADLGRSVDFGNNGKIILKDGFKGKPKKSVAISMWVKLNNVKGTIPLITATDATNFVRYDLLLRNGKGEWVHRGDSGRELFRVQSSSSDVTAGQWHNIVGSYDSVSRTASLWVDGKQVNKQDGISGVLSQKWNKLTIFGGESRGDMDDIFMFRCPLDKTKIVALYVSGSGRKDVKKDVIA